MQRRNERNITQILLAAVILTVGVVVPLRAQTLNVIHNFVGSADGEYPVAGLTMDSAGTLYGTTAGLIYTSGPSYGSVFRLKLHNGSWLFTPLFDFRGGADGAYPLARVVIGPNGTLYGTANRGGIENCTQGCGLVFDLHPTPTIPASPLTPWREIVLYSFQGSTDGAYPGYGDMVFDSTGNMYNTSSQGGINACAGHVGCGVVYKLTKSGGSYTETALYAFSGGSDGAFPIAAVSFDNSSNLYTTAFNGGNGNNGTVIQLTPAGSESTIHQFNAAADGANPWTGVIVDSSGNLYGTTSTSGPSGGGTVYEMSLAGGIWTYTDLENFAGSGPNPGPLADLAKDANGNLYGTNYAGGAHGFGCVFKLTPSNGGYTYTDLYDFTGSSDGANPASNVVLDASGNLYGTAYQGGSRNLGVVWQLIP